MDTMKTVLLGLSFLVAAVVGGLISHQLQQNPTEVTVDHPAGAAASPDVFFHTFFRDGMTQGGFDFATSSRGSVTYTAASFVRANVIEHNAEAALTATLPTNAALSAAGFLPNVGDSQNIYIHASTTKMTLAGSTGVTLATASSTKDISPGFIGTLTCTRLGATEARTIQCLLINS